MNCQTFRWRMDELLDAFPDSAATSELRRHVDNCPNCARELANLQNVVSAVSPSHTVRAESDLKERIMSKIDSFEAVQETRNPVRRGGRFARFAIAAALVLSLIVGGNWVASRGGHSFAFEVLAQAAEATSSITTIHIRANMRSLEDDNFDLIEPELGFVPVEIWKVYGARPAWRVEKPKRVVVMDGRTTVMLENPGMGGTTGYKHDKPATGFVGWLAPLLDVQGLLDHEREEAREQGSKVLVAQGKDSDGRLKTTLTIRATAQGDFSQSDYVRNTSVIYSDNTRVYVFDAATHRLEAMKVYMHTAKGDVLVFEITGIEYDAPVDSALLTANVPEDTVWAKDVTEANVPDNSWMTPKQAATAWFEAMANEDWKALSALDSHADDPRVQSHAGGLKIIHIGEPFKSGLYPGWFVPYEVQLKSGEVKKHNLAMRNDNDKGQWEKDGGF